MDTIKFERMDEPNIYGYCTQRPDDIQVEVVQIDSCNGAWNVFLTKDGTVIARSVAEYRQCKDGYLSRFDAFKIARSLAS